MNWFNAAEKVVSILSLLLLTACSGGGLGSATSVDGFLVSLSAADAGSLPTQATVVVTGRNEEEFPVEFDSKSVPPGKFQMKNLPSGKKLTFQVSGGVPNTIETTLTFPILVSGSMSLNIPILPAGTIQAWIDDVNSPTGVLNSFQVQPLRGIVVGALAPDGRGCLPITGVDIVDKSEGASVLLPGQNGPFYFDTLGKVVAGQISDPECGYIIFNVPAGDYTFTTIGSASSEQTSDLVVLSGGTVVGYGIPMKS